jgi:glycosyltransferase involved in cell wall biosynthesis
MIARNEERNIGRALDSILPYVDEAIVIDDESDDNTIGTALARGPKVHVFRSGVTERPAFPDVQKNAAIDKASGDIIFVLDCDEIVDPDIRQVMPELERILMEDEHEAIGFFRRSYIDGVIQNPYDPDYQIRMWRNGLGIHSGENLHEGIVGWNEFLRTSLIIWHYKTAAMQQEDNLLYQALGQEFK